MPDSQPGRTAPARPIARVATMVICALAGFMLMSSAINARGNDLRPARNDNLAGLVADEAKRNQQLLEEVQKLREEIDAIAYEADPALADAVNAAEAQAGMHRVNGPAVQVTLTDAPLTMRPPGVDEDALVVHQQDIQQVVNALWEGGAEAMTIQGQRVVSSTAVKCVGNSIVLHGVPYAPPYVVTAIGNQSDMIASLDASPGVRTFREYAAAYQLGYNQTRLASVTMEPYAGRLPQGTDVPK